MISLADSIKKRMAMLGIKTVAEAARQCELQQRTFSLYHSGHRLNPRPDQMKKLVRGLKTTEEELRLGRYRDEESQMEITSNQEQSKNQALWLKTSLRLSQHCVDNEIAITPDDHYYMTRILYQHIIAQRDQKGELGILTPESLSIVIELCISERIKA